MEEAVVGAVVGVAFQVGIENVTSLLREKIDLVGDFKEDLEKLKSSLIMIQSILYDAEMQQVTSRAVKLWLKKLENLAFGAEHALDEFNYQLLHEERNNRESQTTMMKKVKSIFSGSHSRDPRRKLGHKIREINQELESINQEARNFRLPMGSVGARAPGARAPGAGSDAFAGLETDSFTVDPIFIGRDNDVSRIVEMLTSIPTDQQVFSILPIVGMGGLGKTTLTRKVYHDEKIAARFATRIWVHVSTNFDPVSLFKKILSSLGSRNVEGGSREFLLKELQEALRAKTYLLVLDDVWNQDHAIWEGFINSLSGISSTRGNGIIVTTRNSEVASIVRTLSIYELKGLPVDKCWSIIKAKTFGGGDVPSEFEIIGKNIANMCRGLPLAANIVGGLLRRKSKDDWLSIERNWLPGENNISKILKLSFDNLYFPALKKCFAYCAIFPKGRWIMRQQLIELWMGEGFLQPDQENDMETLGNKFFNLLLQNSLLQKGWGDGYLMHDLVHDLACSVLGSCEVNDCSSEGICQVRYVGLKKYGDKSSQIPKEAAKYLRTLFFKGAISNVMFSHFECLHTLTLKGFHITQLPISIGKLIHLRNLNIAYTRIEYLPDDSIGELYLLQTLRTTDDDLFATCHLKKLPGTLKYLISLRHLHISHDTEFPHEVGRLTSLQTLPYFPVGKEDGQKIVELGGLKNLKGKLTIYNLEKVPDKEEAKSACLFQKPNLVRLDFSWNQFREGERNDENVLEGLQPHPNLKSFHIEGFKGTHFPSWTMKMAVRDEVEGRWVGLDNLIEISLSNCKECEEIPMLGHLPHLKSLNLEGLTKVRSIGSSFYGACKNIVNVFPALERLKLQNMSNLKEWVGVEFAETQPCEVKVFPYLEYLKIYDCKELMSAPSPFPGIKELDVDGVDSGLPLANICGITLTSLHKLTLRGMEDWDSLPDHLQHLTALSRLKLENFGIETLPEWLGNLSSLTFLSLLKCKKLRSMPSKEAMQRLTKLQSLRIQECPVLEGRCNMEQQNDDSDSEWPKISHIPDVLCEPWDL